MQSKVCSELAHLSQVTNSAGTYPIMHVLGKASVVMGATPAGLCCALPATVLCHPMLQCSCHTWMPVLQCQMRL